MSIKNTVIPCVIPCVVDMDGWDEAVSPDEAGFILLESGDSVLLESGDKVIKE